MFSRRTASGKGVIIRNESKKRKEKKRDHTDTGLLLECLVQ